MTDDHITTDVIGLSTTLERFDADAENPVSLITADDDGVLHIADLDQLSRDIDFINDQLDNTVFTPEDRAFVKDGRAKVNKLNKAIVSAVRDEKSRVFDELDRERKSVEKKLDAINKSLGRTLQDFDKQVREEKRAEMESSFADAVELSGDARLNNLSFTEVENPSWSNRSSSHSKSVSELDSRLSSVIVLLDNNDDMDVHQVVESLELDQWDLSKTMMSIKAERERIAQEKREAEEAHQRALEEARAEVRREMEEQDTSDSDDSESGESESAGRQQLVVSWEGTADTVAIRREIMKVLTNHEVKNPQIQ